MLINFAGDLLILKIILIYHQYLYFFYHQVCLSHLTTMDNIMASSTKGIMHKGFVDINFSMDPSFSDSVDSQRKDQIIHNHIHTEDCKKQVHCFEDMQPDQGKDLQDCLGHLKKHKRLGSDLPSNARQCQAHKDLHRRIEASALSYCTCSSESILKEEH